MRTTTYRIPVQGLLSAPCEAFDQVLVEQHLEVVEIDLGFLLRLPIAFLGNVGSGRAGEPMDEVLLDGAEVTLDIWLAVGLARDCELKPDADTRQVLLELQGDEFLGICWPSR